MSQNTLQWSSTNNIHIRILCPSDIDRVKQLCKEWFPIKYPDTWYEDLISSNKFYSLVATFNEQVIGLLVTEIKLYSTCNYEDIGLLCNNIIDDNTRVVYILTLGVIRHMRRHGVATILLKNLINNLTINPLLEDCKAIYLHVLTTNVVAICFYEKLYFKQFKFLPLYYLINNCACDGYSYVLYINGGRPPFSILHLTTQIYETFSGCASLLFRRERLLYIISTKSYLNPFKWIKKLYQNSVLSVYRKFFHTQVNDRGYLYTC